MKQHLRTPIKAASLLLLASLMSPPAALAVETLAPIVVSAQRLATNLGDVSADVSVISRQDIEASQASSVADVLRTQAGLDVASNGGAGTDTSVFIRGGNSKHTVVLIDGVRVGSATLGSFNWGNLSTADIERIEIVRGAQSSLYGADAMGGVIQIFTRQGQLGLKTTAGFEAGTYSTKKTHAAVRGGDANGATYGISIEDFRTDGFSAASNGTEADANKRLTLGGQVAFSSGKIDTAINVRRSDATTGLDGYDAVTYKFGDILNYNSNDTQTTAAIKLTDHMSDHYESSLQLSRSIDDSVGSDPVNASNNSDFKTNMDQLTWLNQYDTADGSLVLGYDGRSSQGDSTSDNLHESITQHGVFLSMLSNGLVNQWNASVRYDKNSASSNETTYKLGSVFHVNEDMRLTANYGTGFKAPTINDLYYPDSGNPKLRAETSKGWDIGAEYKTANALFNVVYFKQNYSNLIAWTSDANSLYSPNNINAASTKGFEVQSAYQLDWGFARANYTKLKATDDTTGNWLARRANHTANIVLGTDMGGLHVETEMKIVGQRFDDAKNKNKLDAYKLYHLRLSYAVHPALQLQARINNIQDTVYEEVKGYGSAGRASYVGVSATF